MNKSDVAKIFGEEIRLARNDYGISQEALALKADVDRSFLSKMERGIRQPTITILFKLCDAIGLPPDVMILKIKSRLDEGEE